MTGLKMLLDPTRVGNEAETLESDLHKKIVGQDSAIRQITGIYQTFVAGMSSQGRPIGSFLFLGPTGSGKTRTVEAVAESLVGDPNAVIKIDCAEYAVERPPLSYLKQLHPMNSLIFANDVLEQDRALIRAISSRQTQPLLRSGARSQRGRCRCARRRKCRMRGPPRPPRRGRRSCLRNRRSLPLTD